MSAAVGSSAIVAPPSLARLAKERLEQAILSGDYLPGERLVEERLCDKLGVSRPPVREALKALEIAGLVESVPRKGARVVPLTKHDVYEIVTLRTELERMSIPLAGADLRPERLERCRARIRDMEAVVPTEDEGAMALAGFEFHIAVVGLAGHRRMEETYRAMAMQLQLCMAMNNRARRNLEDLEGNVERHRRLLHTIETGSQEQVLREMEQHGHQTFLRQVVDRLDGATPESQRWLESLKQEQTGAQSRRTEQDRSIKGDSR